MSLSESKLKNVQLTGPFDSVRDYITALEASGRLLRIKEMDQDKYEATAFAYRLIDKFGLNEAPAFVIERVKIGGKWIKGPLFSNIYGGWITEAMGYGVEGITDDNIEMYRAAINKVIGLADGNGELKRIKPNVTDRRNAPCKEVIIIGDDVDILQYPFLKVNPADGGRYINMGAVIIEDPELGRNVGTYRCQIKSERKVSVNPEPGKHGWRQLMAARDRGENSVKAAIILGADPITWAMSCSRITGLGEDEYELAGGLKGQPLELVKCETSDILVPASAEMIIEGEIPTNQLEEEGPHGEMFGYLGSKREHNFFMNIEAITHREGPWFLNVHTGVTAGYHRAAMEAHSYLKYKKTIPNLVAIHSLNEAMGITVASIDKKLPSEGMAAGQQIAASNRMVKVMIVVDKDVDVLNVPQVLHAVSSRWQPYPASLIVRQALASGLEPSAPEHGLISNIVIDATKQLPQEGGPATWPAVSRDLLEEHCPEAFDLVDAKWAEYWKNF